MSRIRFIVAGFLLTFFSSWVGLVLLPIITIGNFKQATDPTTGENIPPDRTALEEQGKEVYIANGCIYCHSQQVRPGRTGTDIARGWGARRTIAADYMNDKRALLGTMRTGPDLSTIGVRNPNADWHLLHLYNPIITSPGSNMAPFPYLFEKREFTGEPSPDALKLPGEFAPPPGIEIVPKQEALALVAYLQSLKIGTYPVPGADRAVIESKIESNLE